MAGVGATRRTAVAEHQDAPRLELAPPRPNPAAWLLAPAVAAFPLANLLEWPWALTGTGALWAVAVGGLLGGREQH